MLEQNCFKTHHKKTILPKNFFHFGEHTHKSTSTQTQKNKHNYHYSITHPSFFHHLVTQSSFTITPTPLIPSPFPDHHNLYLLPAILSSLEPCALHLTSTNNTHQPSSSSVLHKLLPFYTHFMYSTSQPAHKAPIKLLVILQAMLAHYRTKSGSFRIKVGRCRPPQPSFYLATTIIIPVDANIGLSFHRQRYRMLSLSMEKTKADATLICGTAMKL